LVAFLADWHKVSSIAFVRKPTLPSFKFESAKRLCGLAHVSARQPGTLNPESPVIFRNRCDVENFCDDRRREVAKFTASCWVTLSAKNFRFRPKAVLRIILDTFFYSEHMLKKSVIVGAIGIFVSVIAVSLWMQKSSIGVLMMSLFGME